MKAKLSILLLAACVLTLFSACGGSGIGDPDPTPVVTGLDGQLIQGGGQKVTSAQGDALSGITVQLISALSGAIAASAVTDAQGRFSFRHLPNGSYLLKLRFRASVDLDADGSPDDVEIFLPVEVVEDIITEIVQELELEDSLGDGKPDSIKVNIRIDVNGQVDQQIRIHRHRHGRLDVDADGDGNVDDSFDDTDADGMPEDDRFQGPRGPKLRGVIDSIDDSSLTVDGQEFLITDATVFRIRGNQNANPDEFDVGDEVQVTSFVNDAGESVAVEIKLKREAGHPGTDDDEIELEGFIEALSATEITVNGQTFQLDDRTLFLLDRKTEGELSDFAVGDFVELKAKLIGGEWIALRLKLEDADDGAEREVRGVITALSDTSISVDGETFVIDSGTEFFLFGNDPGTLADFDIGDTVELKAMLDGGDWVVTRLKLEVDAPDEPGDFMVQFLEFTPHIGHNLYLKVAEADGGTVVGSAPVTLISEDEFSLSIPDILESGVEYNIDFWADFDGNGILDGTPIGDPSGVDHAWRLTETADGDGISLVFTHDTNFTDIRPFFEPGDFSMDFTGFEPHLGHYLYLKVKEAASGDTVWEAPLTLVSDAEFTLAMADVLEAGVEYNIDFWADFDGNGTLDGTPISDPPGVDHAWRLTETADADGISIVYAHDTNFTDIRPF